ncbi:SUKH-4 family immunity protein [Streptomyces sp. KD18]|uniref:SUKH-4 family immunity protein n=1 Tax=Streptomyces sp. KD18 TaxID=2773452 RepID=UPI00168BC87E|nr:SUKH-4 family immunity protein [Streptomyces sp. KD18]MBD3579083.1 SUKH-4 family immunity protein [Streptomyces sp. KD18]
MVTFAQAQERAEEWINGGVPPYQHREVRVREFGLGFVVWAEDRAGGPVAGGGRQRLVIARDSGEVTLWPGLPVGEVIRRYEEEYGAAAVQAAEPSVPAPRIDSEQTSFMLSPPEWLQEAADRAGIPPAPAPVPVAESVPAAESVPGPAAAADGLAGASAGAGAAASGDGDAASGAAAGSGAADVSPAVAAEVPEPVPLRREVPYEPTAEGGVPVGATPWAGTDVTPGADDASVPLPATVFAPPLSGSDLDDASAAPSVSPEARTQLMPAGSALPKTAIAPALDLGGAPPAPAAAPGSPEALAQEPTGKAPVAPPAPPAAPGAPGAGQPPVPPGPPGAPGSMGRGLDHAATMLAGPAVVGGPPAPPGPPPAPGAQPPAPPAAPGGPGTPPGGIEHAATMLAGPAVVAGPSAPPPAPAASGTPTVGPGYQAVLRYRGNDGSEQQIIRRSAPGTPHPEWQILHELRAMNVPPQQVLELHTELESCELPGGYCARMIRETWPQVRITSVAPYGKDHAGRQAGMRHLLTHQGELHQVADGPARPAPVRAPLPQVPLQPAIPLDAIGAELAGAFGPQGVFRFDQRAVSRQGVPDIVAQTLMWAGLPTDFGPFFWAQAVPGQPVPTLAELALQRQVQPASDAGSYLVIGSDFGKALCVQYGTAHIVAVPVEGGPGGAPVPPQFVNSSLPQFARSIAMLGHMWRLRQHLTPEQAGRWTVDFQANLAGLDSAALTSPESWWSVLLEQMWDGLL